MVSYTQRTQVVNLSVMVIFIELHLISHAYVCASKIKMLPNLHAENREVQ